MKCSHKCNTFLTEQSRTTKKKLFFIGEVELG